MMKAYAFHVLLLTCIVADAYVMTPLRFCAPGMLPSASRTSNELKMQGTDTMHRSVSPMQRALNFMNEVAAGAKRVSSHRLFHRNTPPPPPQEASMADQVSEPNTFCTCSGGRADFS